MALPEERWHGVPEEHWKAWLLIFRDDPLSPDLKAPCPVCGGIALHRYYDSDGRPSAAVNDRRGGLWEWCSGCRKFAHYSCFVPAGWVLPYAVNLAELTAEPESLEIARVIALESSPAHPIRD